MACMCCVLGDLAELRTLPFRLFEGLLMAAAILFTFHSSPSERQAASGVFFLVLLTPHNTSLQPPLAGSSAL